MASVTIGGTVYNFRPWPEMTVTRAIRWAVNSAGNRMGADRGVAMDTHESVVKFIDTETNINSLISVLNSNRETVDLTSFQTDVFIPEVNHTGTITCAHEIIGERKRVFHATTAVYEMDVKFRAIAPTLIGTSASLSSLRIQESPTADQTWSLGRAFSETGAQFYADHKRDNGALKATFSQTTTQMKAILSYLLTTSRAATITLPTFSGLTYPFGYLRGTGPFNAKALSFSVKRNNLNRWTLDIEFAEVA
jgi:cytochrome c556